LGYSSLVGVVDPWLWASRKFEGDAGGIAENSGDDPPQSEGPHPTPTNISTGSKGGLARYSMSARRKRWPRRARCVGLESLDGQLVSERGVRCMGPRWPRSAWPAPGRQPASLHHVSVCPGGDRVREQAAIAIARVQATPGPGVASHGRRTVVASSIRGGRVASVTSRHPPSWGRPTPVTVRRRPVRGGRPSRLLGTAGVQRSAARASSRPAP